MTTDVEAARSSDVEQSNPFGAIANIFTALARFFGDPAVQAAGRRLLADLDLDDEDDFPSLSGTVDNLERLTLSGSYGRKELPERTEVLE